MAILPGWNSLAAAGSIAHSLHIAAMIVLAVLVVAEGMALVYDDRKYALIGAAERDVTATYDEERRQAEGRHHNGIAELQRRLEETQRQQASRGLTFSDQQTLVAALSPFPGQHLEINFVLGDPEAQQFANNFGSDPLRAPISSGSSAMRGRIYCRCARRCISTYTVPSRR